MYKKPLPAYNKLHHHFSYDPQTGDLTWKNPTHGHCTKGPICPKGKGEGYKYVGLEGEGYLIHRIVWKMMTGADPHPDLAIDHKDHDPGNNRWENLQQVSLTHNVSRSNKFKRLPVVTETASGVFVATRKDLVTGTSVYLGTYSSHEAAKTLDPTGRRVRQIARPKIRKTRYNTWELRLRDKQLGTYHSKEAAEKAASRYTKTQNYT